MHHSARCALIVGCLAMAVARGSLALNILPKNCLQKLSERTQEWTECTERFSRSDDRCKLATARMGSRMQECRDKGYAKSRIDAAMAKGNRAAGKPKKGQ